MTVPADVAREIARLRLEADLPRRWRHVQSVGRKAERVAAVLDGEDQAALVAAAWLHDVGYSPALVDTGFHSLDGAMWLQAQGVDARVTALVAHHSCAWLEADERGLSEELAEFSREESATADALCYSDMTTGPDGQNFEVLARLGEIRTRYGPEHLVTRFILRAEPEIVCAVRRTEERLAGAGLLQPM